MRKRAWPFMDECFWFSDNFEQHQESPKMCALGIRGGEEEVNYLFHSLIKFMAPFQYFLKYHRCKVKENKQTNKRTNK